MTDSLVYQLMIVVGASTIFATVFHYLKQPTIVGFILAGIIVGPYGTGLVKSLPGAHLLSEIGVIFLLFTIGLEFSFRRLSHLKKAFFGLGVTQVLVTLVLVALIFFLFGWSWQQAIFFGCLVSLSSTAIVMKLLQESREAAAPYGTTTLSILLSQDLAVIPMMLALPLLAVGQQFTTGMAGSGIMIWGLKFAGVSSALFVGAKWVIPFFLEN